MKAMIFAAGLGTRLRPLTNDRPKALVEVGGRPLLEWAIRLLKKHGFDDLIINVHHFSQQIVDFIDRKAAFGISIQISDESDLLLDTGGGLKKARSFFDEAPFLVYNADVLTNMDLTAFYQQHLQSGALATLAVRNRPSSRMLLFDEGNSLVGWKNNSTGEQVRCRDAEATKEMAFSGIHAISPLLLEHFPEEAVFSIIPLYLRLGAEFPIKAYAHDADSWVDVGKASGLERAAELIVDLSGGHL
ncbi:MAG TPA: nucleotidyltransferase family protein [Saprospiraceae bacterium]|mgnify:CR=1 FL=1|nr:nucleotidyltransferase family protein [Saprospiraceae bacterium]